MNCVMFFVCYINSNPHFSTIIIDKSQILWADLVLAFVLFCTSPLLCITDLKKKNYVNCNGEDPPKLHVVTPLEIYLVIFYQFLGYVDSVYRESCTSFKFKFKYMYVVMSSKYHMTRCVHVLYIC